MSDYTEYVVCAPLVYARYHSSQHIAGDLNERSMLDHCADKVFGGAGVSDDYPIASAFTSLRTLRIADGPDEVHKRTLARLEVKKVLLQNELKNKEEFINHKQKSRL